MAGDVQTILRERLAAHPDVAVALLFGSTARGTEAEGSDVDLAVLAPSSSLLALGAELTLALGREVDVLDLTRAPIPVLERIVNEGILVHEGARGSAAEWRSHALATLETDLPGYRRMRDAWLRRVAERGL